MHLRKAIAFMACLTTLPACSTMNESLLLGGTLGAAGGAAATYVAQSTAPSAYKNPPHSGENILAGAGIGLAVGLLTSYFVHGKVATNRDANTQNGTEMYFGDLPPSPFVFPKNQNRKDQ